jgi:catechol 2,3-dioxygenase-like lactoylglutathione lyase family enzyme
MIDHVGFAVSDLKKSMAFYARALDSLGISLLYELTAEQTGGGAHAGFGSGDKAFFWIGDHGRPGGSAHIAFAAQTRAQVESFYHAALKAGGKDNGPPGVRAHYHPNYYGAFVLDPDGNNVEAVCHAPA